MAFTKTLPVELSATMVDRTTGDPLIAGVTAEVWVDGGAAGASAGTLTHKGDGVWTYLPDASEQNADALHVKFIHATGVIQVRESYPDIVKLSDGLDLGSILGTAITEPSAGRFANNWDFFFGNNDAQTTKVVDDVGTAQVPLPETFLALSSAGQTAGTFADTHFIDGNFLTLTGISAAMTLDFNVGIGITPVEMNLVIIFSSGGGTRSMLWQVRNFTLAQWDTVETIPNNGVEEIYTSKNFPSGDANDYVDGAGVFRYQIVNGDHGSSVVEVDAANVIAVTVNGSVPTPGEIAIVTDAVLSQSHGAGSWHGDYTLPISIDSVTSQVEFVLNKSTIGFKQGMFLTVVDDPVIEDITEFDGSYITNYQPDTPIAGQATVTIIAPLNFTVDDTMLVLIRQNPPASVSGFTTDQGISLLSETTQGNLSANFSSIFDNADILTTRTVDALMWTPDEEDQIRYRLQLDGVQVAPTVDAPLQLPIDLQAWDGEILGGIPMTEDDGSGNSRWTAKALEEAPNDTVLLPEGFLATSILGWTSGVVDDTFLVDDNNILLTGASAVATIDFNIGSANIPFEVLIVPIFTSAGGLRTFNWSIWNDNLGQWDSLGDFENTGVKELETERNFPSGNSADYVSAAGLVRYQLTNGDHATSELRIDFTNCTSLTATGSVPTVSQIANGVNLLLTNDHGSGSWNGDYTNTIEIDAVNTQTEFVLTESIDGIEPGTFLMVFNAASRGAATAFDAAYITDYQADTPTVGQATVTIANVLSFTVLDTYVVQLRLSPPADIASIAGTLLTETTDGRLANNFSTLYDNADAASALTLDAIATVNAVWAHIAEGTLTTEQILRVILSATSGKSNSHELGTPKYRDLADTKDRISAITDANGNRTSSNVDGT